MEENKGPFILDSKRALIGSVNGILFYDLVWPYCVLLLMHLILQGSYNSLVDTKPQFMSLILVMGTSVLTLIAAVIIAKPQTLIGAYKKINLSNVKFIFKCLISMFIFSYCYNLILIMSGIDVSGGNANQGNVLILIQSHEVLAFIAMVIIAPLLEEITYRYFLFGGIAKYNRKWAIVISAFVFMAVHATASFTQNTDNIFRELVLLPPYMFSGMVLAYAYDKSNNLTTSTTIHALNNLISFVLCLL